MNDESLRFFFVSHSIRQDESIRKKLEASLSGVLATEKATWLNSEEDTDGLEKVSKADVVILLISPNFIHLYCQRSNLRGIVEQAKKRQKKEDACLIPILLHPTVNWKETLKLPKYLEFLPKDSKPISDKSRSINKACFIVSESIQELVDKIKNDRKAAKEYDRRLDQFRNSVLATKFNFPLGNQEYEIIRDLGDRYSISNEDALSFVKQLVEERKPLERCSSSAFDERQEQGEQSFQEGFLESLPIMPRKAWLSAVLLFVALIVVINVPNQRSLPSNNSIRPSQTKFESSGWIWLGAVRSPSRELSTGDTLEVDVSISSSQIPAKGAVVTIARTANLRRLANGSEVLGEVLVGEKLVIMNLKVFSVPGKIIAGTEVWAEVHRCGESCPRPGN